MSRYVISEWLPVHPHSRLRVLSVPSSTGEEPYSIAIALLESGLLSKKFHIDAVDISKKSLRYAQHAVYSRNSFRGDSIGLQNRFFTQTTDGYQLCESVRNTVNFRHGNLLERQFLAEETPYDVIFCRNLLIYFDQSARNQAAQVLYRLLTKNGLLFVGHSETRQISSHRFASVNHPSAFAFRKVEETLEARKVEEQGSRRELTTLQAQNSKLSSVSRLTSLELAADQRSDSKRASAAIQNSTTPIPFKPTTDNRQRTENGQTILETARTLADQGQLNEAAALCETYLSQNHTSAEAYVLLGQVGQAIGNEEQAVRCFQKAIYLDPNHYEALIHLALLKEHQGDLKSAGVIRQRIQRLQKVRQFIEKSQ